jgi:hypothetical protein
MIELIVLILLIGSLLAWIQYDGMEGFVDKENKTKEGFSTTMEYHLDSCPSGYKSFYDSNGSVMCCDGDVVANQCITEKQCSLSGKGDKIKNCVDLILDDYGQKGQTHCPGSMNSYFENRASQKKGCTMGPLNATLDGPKIANQPTCMIYSTLQESMLAKDSCYHQKKLDEVACFGSHCTKELVSPQANAPALIAIHFTDRSGIHRTAYTRESMENYLSVTNPQWKEQGIDLSKNTSVAEVAKAVFVDKTLPFSSIQM